MSLAPGTRLGPYEVLGPLGAGGMGEVYRATDTNLGRNVAIKVLPGEVAKDTERLARFRREAHLLASLNHPGIAAIHGLEETDGQPFLVLELVEGETLAERMARGRVPLDEALGLARQIAEALEEAHEHGIVHRDLKPANVKLTPEGEVKVLDFGLAKAYAANGDSEKSDLSHSPTLSRQETDAGVILGTAAYMSPEQARGKAVDKRADIWAFGVVLFEMLTGKRLFHGETTSDTLAAVLKTDPDWRLLPAETPARVRELLQRCLNRDPRERQRDMGDARLDIDGALREPGENAASSHRTSWSVHPVAGPRMIVATIAASLLAVAGMAVWMRSHPGTVSIQPIHVPVGTISGVSLFHDLSNPGLAISPDGRHVVYAGASQGRRLYLQELDRPVAAPIAGTEGGLNPFFSSDGKWLAFVAHNKLQKVALSGGEPVSLADAPAFAGGAWAPDDETIYFTPGEATGIWRVSSRGGEPTQVTTPDRDGYDNGHWWPTTLPGGAHLLYLSCCGRNRIVALDLATGRRTPVIENGFFATYVSTGHIVFAQGHSLMAARLDPDRLRVANPVTILDNLVTGHEMHAQYGISRTGSLVYYDGVSDFQRSLVRIERNGAMRGIALRARPYSWTINFAPDGRRLAMTLYDGQQDVFVYDLLRDDFDRVTLDPHNDWSPVWTPDGRQLVFTSVRHGQFDLYVSPPDKSGPDALLYSSTYPKWAESWSPDGKLLAFTAARPGSGRDIMIYSESDKQARPLRESPFNEESPRFSPDGRLLAYTSDELGVPEVYVAPYPGPGPTCKVSTAGGAEPRWSEGGKELFYRRGSTAMVVDVAGGQPCLAKPQALFEGLEPGSWDVSPKGDFFVTLAPREPPRLHLVLNWFEELKQRVPIGTR